MSDSPNEFVAGHGLHAVVHLPLIDHAFPGLEWLEWTLDLLATLRKLGTVLVHCEMGESRSSLVVAAYLMRSRGLGVDAALAALTDRNPHADPNHRFLDGLRRYERVLLSRTAPL